MNFGIRLLSGILLAGLLNASIVSSASASDVCTKQLGGCFRRISDRIFGKAKVEPAEPDLESGRRNTVTICGQTIRYTGPMSAEQQRDMNTIIQDPEVASSTRELIEAGRRREAFQERVQAQLEAARARNDMGEVERLGRSLETYHNAETAKLVPVVQRNDAAVRKAALKQMLEKLGLSRRQ